MTSLKIMASRTVLAFTLVFLSSSSIAQCLVVGDLQGWAVKERNQFTFERDGFSKSSFYLKFGENSWMSNDPETVRVSCADMGVLICPDKNYDQVLTWSVNHEAGKVLHTRTIGNSLFEGAMLMVGRIIGTCDY
jgi:hypothetical protein